MRILVQKSPRPRRWAGVATMAVLMLALWCVKRPGELGAPSAQAAGPGSAQEGTSFLDNLRAPAAVRAAGHGVAPQATSGTPGGHEEAQLAGLAAAHAAAVEHASSSHAPGALVTTDSAADTGLSGAAAHSAQRTGVAVSSSRSTSGAMPTK